MRLHVRKSWLAFLLCFALMGTSVLPGMKAEAEEVTAADETGEQKSTPAESEPKEEETLNESDQNTSDNEGTGLYEGEIAEELLEDSSESPETAGQDEQEKEETVSVEYQAHVQSYGWLKPVRDGAIGGTEKQAKRVEAIQIRLSDLPEKYAGSSIKYAVHVQTYGWRDEVADWAEAGTTGEAKRLEAISIRLEGSIAEDYSVYYRTHVQTFGWLDWAKDGARAGSAQFAKRMEAVEIKLVKKDDEANKPAEVTNYYRCPMVSYQAHVQSYGWRPAAFDNAEGGVTGQSKRMEALKISLPDPVGTTGYSGGIKYRAHVQGIGWQDWKQDGELIGTSGQAKRVEALQVALTGEIAEYYDVYYSLHMAKIGWTNYTLGNEATDHTAALAGSANLSKRVEAVKIKLVKKGDAPGVPVDGRKYIQGYNSGDFYYTAAVQEVGTTDNTAQGDTVGTIGQSKRLEGITLYLNREEGNPAIPSGAIQYAVHLSSSGWTDWVEQGTFCGSSDGSRGMEAVMIRLDGDISNYYDIYYRAHVQKYGWLGWAKNGQAAGTSKIGYRMEALQIRLVSKDAAAPGANDRYYTESRVNPGPDPGMIALANMHSSPTRYIVMVDRSAHTVGVYQGGKGFWSNVHYWQCADGAPGTPTVTGVFSVGIRGYYFNSGAYRCFWFTQFYGDYLFHSVTCWPNGAIADGRVGMALSHGCVRLEMDNAKWIYDNIPAGTTVVVYN